MPGTRHEVVVDLFRFRPLLVADLLPLAGGPPPPHHDRVHIEDPDAVEIVPAARRADLVAVFERAGKPVLVAVIEPQLSRDDEKRDSWPNYVTSLRARHGCDCLLLVVAVDPDVAAWAARPIRTGHPGFDLVPLVIGPSAIPRVTEPVEARRNPELAILSALAHGNDEDGLEIVTAAVEAALPLPRERGIAYADVVVSSLESRSREILEAMVKTKDYEPQSKFVKYILEWEAKGKAEGRAEGKAEDIVTVLQARGLSVSEDVRARILACRDLPTLESWLARAVTVSSTAELLEPGEGLTSTG
ncbi:MAG: hypothetical protein HY720_06165 [Planctomycetes bacterium]|nr:hypothetical protein [Planctomycetota bacterium]